MSAPRTNGGGAPPGPDTACVNLHWALALLRGLLAGGLRTLVLSPGARSTPVVAAAQRLEARGRLELVPILDERSAAFFALGAARASGRAVALLATSGSAPAHWYPAVIEAAEAEIPLVLLSADRPPRLRAWGANQTVDQTRLFGGFVREFHDPGPPTDAPAALKAQSALGRRALAVAGAPRPGPVHLNLPFDEPLVPSPDCLAAAERVLDAGSGPRAAAAAAPAPAAASGGLPLDPWPAGPGVIVCGPGTVPAGEAAAGAGTTAAALRDCAERLGLPVLADPLSGLRAAADGPWMSNYDALLRNPGAARALRPAWVLRLGRAPVSKTLGRWLEGIPSILAAPGGAWSDPAHDALARLTLTPAVLCAALAATGGPAPRPDWLARWRAADARVCALARARLEAPHWHEGQVIRALFAAMADGDGLLCANSLPIRQLDTWSAAALPAGAGPRRLFGNRGTSGIDGQLSTLAGLNHGGVPCWGLLGDLSAWHDLSGLLLARRLDRPLLVLNNGGGRIFDTLPQRALPDFGRLWNTPVAADLARLAALGALGHWCVDAADALAQALAEAGRRPGLIEVRLDADASLAAHQAFWQQVAEAALVPPVAGG